MSVFNYKSRRDPLEGLRSRVAKLEKIFKALRFWEVNDIQQGSKVLKRRRVSPSVGIGMVGRGPWFDVKVGIDTDDAVTSLTAGSGITVSAATGAVTVSHDWAKYEFGIYSITGAVVRVNAGEIQDSLLNVKSAGAVDLTIVAGSTNYIFVEYTYGGAVATKVSTTRPVMDATTYRRILHWWTLVDGVATLAKISHLGNIVVPGIFASEA